MFSYKIHPTYFQKANLFLMYACCILDTGGIRKTLNDFINQVGTTTKDDA